MVLLPITAKPMNCYTGYPISDSVLVALMWLDNQWTGNPVSVQTLSKVCPITRKNTESVQSSTGSVKSL